MAFSQKEEPPSVMLSTSETSGRMQGRIGEQIGRGAFQQRCVAADMELRREADSQRLPLLLGQLAEQLRLVTKQGGQIHRAAAQ